MRRRWAGGWWGSGGSSTQSCEATIRPEFARRLLPVEGYTLQMSQPSSRSPRVLVAYASKYGSTRELAEALAATLAEAGLAVDLRPAGEVRTVAAYGAVILGSGLYSATWLRDANIFIRAEPARPRDARHLALQQRAARPVRGARGDPDDAARRAGARRPRDPRAPNLRRPAPSRRARSPGGPDVGDADRRLPRRRAGARLGARDRGEIGAEIAGASPAD